MHYVFIAHYFLRLFTSTTSLTSDFYQIRGIPTPCKLLGKYIPDFAPDLSEYFAYFIGYGYLKFIMAVAKIRDEIVGRRFLSVSGDTKLKLSKISEWDWRAGVIRAASHRDNSNPELTVSFAQLFCQIPTTCLYLDVVN